jgi:hypothetical protein
LIEQLIAMVLITGALLGLLSTLGATAQGLTIGRQRTIGVSLAKQAMESLQGAAFIDVATGSGASADLLVTAGTPPPKLIFGTEVLVQGGATPYRQTLGGAGTTFSLRTFVTTVTGADYRRITILVDWPYVAPNVPAKHSMSFSSLVYPLNYASYPVSNGSAEVTGGLVTITGELGGDTYNDVHVALPAARADTNASTLRTSLGSAAGPTSYVDLLAGPITSTSCSGAGTDIGECARKTLDGVADNVSTTSAIPNWFSNVNVPFAAGRLTTPRGTTIDTPSGTLTSQTSTDVCSSPCSGVGDGDGVPWAYASSSRTGSSAASATFASSHGVGAALQGSLWTFDTADPWSATAAVDHDVPFGGTVTATAQIAVPKLSVLKITGAPAAFVGAVTVSTVTASASAPAGSPSTPSAVTYGTVTVKLWNGTGYDTVNLAEGASTAMSEKHFVVGDNLVSFIMNVQSQPATLSPTGTAPRSDAVAEHPSILLVTVDVTITSVTQFEPTTTTSTTSTTSSTSTTTTSTTVPTTSSTTVPTTTTSSTTTTTTTVPPTPLQTDAFTIVVDYGRLTAQSTWLATAAS